MPAAPSRAGPRQHEQLHVTGVGKCSAGALEEAAPPALHPAPSQQAARVEVVWFLIAINLCFFFLLLQCLNLVLPEANSVHGNLCTKSFCYSSVCALRSRSIPKGRLKNIAKKKKKMRRNQPPVGCSPASLALCPAASPHLNPSFALPPMLRMLAALCNDSQPQNCTQAFTLQFPHAAPGGGRGREAGAQEQPPLRLPCSLVPGGG